MKEARALGLPSVIGDVLQSLAVARSHAGDVPGARPLFAEALAMFRSVGAERVVRTLREISPKRSFTRAMPPRRYGWKTRRSQPIARSITNSAQRFRCAILRRI